MRCIGSGRRCIGSSRRSWAGRHALVTSWIHGGGDAQDRWVGAVDGGMCS